MDLETGILYEPQVSDDHRQYKHYDNIIIVDILYSHDSSPVNSRTNQNTFFLFIDTGAKSSLYRTKLFTIKRSQ